MDERPKKLKSKDLKKRAEETASLLIQQGQNIHPVIATKKNLVENFWAKKWVQHLSQSETYSLRLAPGRSYLRNGCVIDLNWEKNFISALVLGEHLYEVEIKMESPSEEQLERIRTVCKQNIASWIDLLEGKLSDQILNTLCQIDCGILPDLSSIKCSCTCPDWADMCKHTAAALYATGVKLDTCPDLLFTLRGIEMKQLIPDATFTNEENQNPIDNGSLSSLFGIRID